jgi:hypothetical protein
MLEGPIRDAIRARGFADFDTPDGIAPPRGRSTCVRLQAPKGTLAKPHRPSQLLPCPMGREEMIQLDFPTRNAVSVPEC